jgi:prepilin-type N-terminal cleavage/methylation domain-containing protein
MSPGSKGFTLIEIVVALFLGAIILSGMASVHAFVAGRQTQAWLERDLDSQAIYTIENVRSALIEAGRVSFPAPETSSSEKLSLLNAGGYVFFCLTSNSPKILYRYAGNGALPPILAGWVCGNKLGAEGGAVVAGNPNAAPSSALDISCLFARPTGANNLIKFSYAFRYPSSANRPELSRTGETTVQTQEAMR